MKNSKTNLLLVRHVIKEVFGKGNLNSYENLVAKDVQVHFPASWQDLHPPEVRDAINTKKIDQTYAQAFSFKEMNSIDTINDQNKICVRWHGEGIHKGDLFSIAATYKPFSLSGQTVYCIREEKIEEAWQSWDMLGLLNQIGFSLKSPQTSPQSLLKKALVLSKREKECLKLFLHGKTSKETATELFISFRTVEYYFENLKSKLDCSCKRELYRLARLFEFHQLL